VGSGQSGKEARAISKVPRQEKGSSHEGQTMTIALGIPHAPWVDGRTASLKRLELALGTDLVDIETEQSGVIGRLFSDREPNWSWSHKLWAWGLDTGADHLLQLQDDVIVDANFWPNLKSMLAAVPGEIIGLESVHPASKMIYDNGGNWYTTADGLIGVGYVIPRYVLRELLEWRETKLRPGAYQAISEDTLIDVFCLSTGRKVWHPVPTIIDHDIVLASTYGNDWHTHRRPEVTTVRGAEARGYEVKDVPHLGRFYDGTPRMCRRWVKNFHMSDYERTMVTP
jgi:hypothetical protein